MQNESQHGAERIALCDTLPEALTAATGDTWAKVDGTSNWNTPDGAPGDPATFRGARFRRESDGLVIAVFQVQPWDTRMTAQPSWPRRPDGGIRTIRDAGMAFYNADTPRTTFDPSRPASAIARQIARNVLTPRVTEALAAMRAADAEAEAQAEVAGRWRDRVADATGLTPHVSDNGSGPRVYWHRGERCAYSLESSHDRPGGTLTLELPRDPDTAARIAYAICGALAAEGLE